LSKPYVVGSLFSGSLFKVEKLLLVVPYADDEPDDPIFWSDAMFEPKLPYLFDMSLPWPVSELTPDIVC
jgi:hypothetical protein